MATVRLTASTATLNLTDAEFRVLCEAVHQYASNQRDFVWSLEADVESGSGDADRLSAESAKADIAEAIEEQMDAAIIRRAGV